MLSKIIDVMKKLFGVGINQEIRVNNRKIKSTVKDNTNSEIRIENNIGDKNE